MKIKLYICNRCDKRFFIDEVEICEPCFRQYYCLECAIIHNESHVSVDIR